MGVGPAGALESFPGPWHRDGSSVQDSNAERDGIEDERTCSAPAAPVSTTTTTPSGGSSVSQTVTVVVPPIVRVQSDEGGVLSVRTNAARPPAPGDLVYLTDANGDHVPADDALVARVMSARWADGSWCSTTAEHRSVG